MSVETAHDAHSLVVPLGLTATKSIENSDREAVGRRAEPVVLGERDLGTLSILGRGQENNGRQGPPGR